MIKKFFKNNTDRAITIVNINIEPNEIVEIESTMWLKLMVDGFANTYIQSGEIIVNNGIADLSIENGLKLLYTLQEVFEIDSTRNFSFRDIFSGNLVLIPEDQQMYVYQSLRIRDGGELEIKGEVVVR